MHEFQHEFKQEFEQAFKQEFRQESLQEVLKTELLGYVTGIIVVFGFWIFRFQAPPLMMAMLKLL